MVEFLTVYAVLDDSSQARLGKVRALLREQGIYGTQTDSIPFHISLGSYPPENRQALTERIRRIGGEYKAFSLNFTGLDSFGGKVLFAKPEESEGIRNLRAEFCSDYPNSFPYCPHCTILQDDGTHMERAQEILSKLELFPFSAEVTGIEMGLFFPARRLCATVLGKNMF